MSISGSTASVNQVTHAMSAAASRVGDVDTTTAAKSLASMLDVQPWQLAAESLFPLENVQEMAKVKFWKVGFR